MTITSQPESTELAADPTACLRGVGNRGTLAGTRRNGRGIGRFEVSRRMIYTTRAGRADPHPQRAPRMSLGSVVTLTGPPGAGKATVALLVADSLPLRVHLHSDDFFRYIPTGIRGAVLARGARRTRPVQQTTSPILVRVDPSRS